MSRSLYSSFLLLLILAAPAAIDALPEAKAYPATDGPLDGHFVELQREWEASLEEKDCGPGVCINGSYCDNCLCYAPDSDVSRAFCECRLADPACGFGECVGDSWCEGPHCPAPVCYTDTHPISQVLCQGAELGRDCQVKTDCGPGYCEGESYCDDCQCYAPSAPISQAACRCDLMDPTCGLGECVGSSWCEGPHCSAPVCYTPSHPVSLVLCGGAELDCNCEIGCVTPPPAMTAWWTLDEPSGTTAADLAGSHHGTHQNGPFFVTGQVDGARGFDGVDDQVVAPVNGFHNYVDLTLDAWIRPDTLDPDGQVIVSFGNYLYELSLEGSELRLIFQPSPSSYAPRSNGANIQAGTWTHVAVVADNSAGELRFYVNGQVATIFTSYSASSSHTGSEWRIGAGRFGDHFDGWIDEVEVFERALTQAEIQSIYNAGSAGKCKPR